MADIAILKKLQAQRTKSAWYTPIDEETGEPYGDPDKPFRIHLLTPKSAEWRKTEEEYQAMLAIEGKRSVGDFVPRDVQGFIAHRVQCHIDITLGWEGLVDTDGNEVPCTPQTMKNLYSDIDFRIGLFAFTSSLANYATTPEDDAQKKLLNGANGDLPGESISNLPTTESTSSIATTS